MPNATTAKDLKNFPLRPKQPADSGIPVRVTWLGTTPETQNQRARIAMGDKGIKDLVAWDNKNNNRAAQDDADYAKKKRAMQAEALRK